MAQLRFASDPERRQRTADPRTAENAGPDFIDRTDAAKIDIADA